jgi:hypothetical protein
MKSTLAPVAITLHPERWSVRLFEQVFTGHQPLPLPMPKSWFFTKQIHVPAHELQTIPAS